MILKYRRGYVAGRLATGEEVYLTWGEADRARKRTPRIKRRK